jgi:hypothetical protein
MVVKMMIPVYVVNAVHVALVMRRKRKKMMELESSMVRNMTRKL